MIQETRDVEAQAQRLAAATGYEVLADWFNVGYFSRINGEKRPPFHSWRSDSCGDAVNGWEQADAELKEECAAEVAAAVAEINSRYQRPMVAWSGS